jgi:hypothetical protein
LCELVIKAVATCRLNTAVLIDRRNHVTQKETKGEHRYGTKALLVASLVAISPVLKAVDVADSEQVSQLLSDAKTETFQLKEDAATMHMYCTSGLHWQAQARASGPDPPIQVPQ